MQPEAVKAEHDRSNDQAFRHRQECTEERQNQAPYEHHDIDHYILPQFDLPGEAQNINDDGEYEDGDEQKPHPELRIRIEAVQAAEKSQALIDID